MNPLSPVISSVKPLLLYLKKRQENEKFIKSFEIGFTFITITFFLIFAIKPTAVTISGLVGEIKSKQLLVKQMRSKINNIVVAQDAFSQVQEKYQIVESSLPDSPRFYHSSNQIRLASAESQIIVDKLSFKLPTEETQNLKSYSANINQTAEFNSIMQLISRLQDSRRLIDLHPLTISLKTAKDKDSTPSATSFILNTQLFYWQPSNEKK